MKQKQKKRNNNMHKKAMTLIKQNEPSRQMDEDVENNDDDLFDLDSDDNDTT